MTLGFARAFDWVEWAIVARAARIEQLQQWSTPEFVACWGCNTLSDGVECCVVTDMEQHLFFGWVRADALAGFYAWEIDEVLSK